MGIIDQFVVRTLPFVPRGIVARLSRPYIAGAKIEEAIQCVKDLNRNGFRATVDILGEFVTSFEQAIESKEGYMEVLDAIAEHQLDSNISIKPTSFGLLLDRDKAEGLLREIMEKVVSMDNFMRLDMEDSPCTTMTIDLYDRLRKDFPDKVGVVLQSYLRRTVGDVKAITQGKAPSNFRLCKGIYVEPEKIAFKGYQEVRDNFVQALEEMFKGGAFVGIATHDDFLVEKAEEIIQRLGLGPDRYEFQMLLGVRERLRDQIKSRGHNLRIYVPFGKDWYGYSVRRLKENPALAGTFFKAMFIKN